MLVRRLKSLAALARVMRAVRRRDYADCPEVFYTQADRIRLTADKALPWTIDGEYKGDIAQADIEILPAALQLVW